MIMEIFATLESWWITVRLWGVRALFPQSGIIFQLHFVPPQSGELFRLKAGQRAVIAWNHFDMEKKDAS